MQADDGNTQRISVHCPGPASAMGRRAGVKLQTRPDLGHTGDELLATLGRVMYGVTYRVTYRATYRVDRVTLTVVHTAVWRRCPNVMVSAPSAHIRILSRTVLPVAIGDKYIFQFETNIFSNLRQIYI